MAGDGAGRLGGAFVEVVQLTVERERDDQAIASASRPGDAHLVVIDIE